MAFHPWCEPISLKITSSPATFTRIALGCIAYDLTVGLRGNIMSARVSNIARSASYALAATEALYNL